MGYQIQLAAGQFARFGLAQRAIDSVLILTAPDGKQLVEMNLSGIGEQESLSLEVAAAGSYRLTVRGDGAAEVRGSYPLEASVRTTATAPDRKLLAAQALLLEADELAKQTPQTAPQVIGKLKQALPLWRELDMPDRVALTLNRIGRTHISQNQNESEVVRRCRIYDGKAGGVLVLADGTGTLEECDIYENSFTGVWVRQNANLTIRKCNINRNAWQAVAVHDDASLAIEDCDLTANIKGPGMFNRDAKFARPVTRSSYCQFCKYPIEL